MVGLFTVKVKWDESNKGYFERVITCMSIKITKVDVKQRIYEISCKS